METEGRLTPLDRLYLDRAYELALRGRGSTSPNPIVGAVVVRDGEIAGEGYHRRAGGAHAETNALANAGDVRGGTLYVTLEPCQHHGRQPPCVDEVVRRGIARVVVGALDPNPITAGRGVEKLVTAGLDVDVVGERRFERLIEDFRVWIRGERPYIALKMAASLDGFVASEPGVRQQLTGTAWASAVRDLRISHDAVMVGAGTVRVDDPQLTVRPEHPRGRPYSRIVVCETHAVPHVRRVFEHVRGYTQTLVLAPGAAAKGGKQRKRFRELEESGAARVAYVGSKRQGKLDLRLAMESLLSFGIYSVLCEGGPTLASRLIGGGLVDRIYWGVAPLLLAGKKAVPALTPEAREVAAALRFDRVEKIGEDALMTGRFGV